MFFVDVRRTLSNSTATQLLKWTILLLFLAVCECVDTTQDRSLDNSRFDTTQRNTNIFANSRHSRHAESRRHHRVAFTNSNPANYIEGSKVSAHKSDETQELRSADNSKYNGNGRSSKPLVDSDDLTLSRRGGVRYEAPMQYGDKQKPHPMASGRQLSEMRWQRRNKRKAVPLQDTGAPSPAPGTSVGTCLLAL